MSQRVEAPRAGVMLRKVRVAAAIRETFARPYTRSDLRSDVLAGLVVGVVALPLSMALAIATGVPPQFGLYTAIVAGAAIAILGGSSVQVSGPTAAFVVILAPITAEHGLAGLALATMMAGLMQIAMGVGRLGRLIQFVPHPVTTGFTAGIGVVIATLQLKDFLGLSIEHTPETFAERIAVILHALPSTRWPDLLIGAIGLVILIGWDRISRRVPAPIVALGICAIGAVLLEKAAGVNVVTIADRFGTPDAPYGVPQLPPRPDLPWRFTTGVNGEAMVLSLDIIRELLPAAVAIALLGSIESLLSAVVADGMSGQTHDPDGELIGQGAGNVIAPFFGGFAATGAIARTAANIRFGARSPIASIVHAAFVLLAVLLLAPVLGYLPMAALAALLLRVAWNMSEARHFLHTVRIAPRSDVVVLVTCFLLTVIFDMVIAVFVGVVLAAILFMRRMAEVADVRLISERHQSLGAELPPHVLVYEIAGPLFFGAAQKAMSALRSVGGDIRTVIIDLEAVPVMDATGLVNLGSALDRLGSQNLDVILTGVQAQPWKVMHRARLLESRPHVSVHATVADAIAELHDA